MCEPVTMGIMMGVTAIGTGIQAFSQHQQGAEMERAFRENQRQAMISAQLAHRAGQQAAGQTRMEGSRVVGAQQVAAGASGIDPGSSVAMRMQDTTRVFAELDAQTIMANAAREAWGHAAESANFGQMARAAAQQKKLGPLATILGGAGQVAMMGYGAFGGGGGYQSQFAQGGGGGMGAGQPWGFASRLRIR